MRVPQLYKKEDIVKAMVALSRPTKMVDFCINTYQSLPGNSEVPAGELFRCSPCVPATVACQLRNEAHVRACHAQSFWHTKRRSSNSMNSLRMRAMPCWPCLRTRTFASRSWRRTTGTLPTWRSTTR